MHFPHLKGLVNKQRNQFLDELESWYVSYYPLICLNIANFQTQDCSYFPTLDQLPALCLLPTNYIQNLVFCLLYSVHFKRYSVCFTQNNVHCILYILQYIILKYGILRFNSFNITSKRGIYFTVHSLGSIRTNCQEDL